MKAWIVTWDWASDSAALADELAAVFPADWTAAQVAEHVECLYAVHTSTFRELMAYAEDPSANPYRAKWERALITCGHHPFLVARPVDDITVEADSDGLETVSWKEPDRSTVDSEGLPLAFRDKVTTVKRRISGSLSAMPIWDRSVGGFKPGWGPGETPSVY